MEFADMLKAMKVMKWNYSDSPPCQTPVKNIVF